MWIAIFFVSLFVLVKASGYFTGAAQKIGLMIGISQFIVGATIVSIGTSLPELISSILAAVNGVSEIVAGNVIGSNIANILLILGVGAIASQSLNFRHNILPVDLPIFMSSAFLLAMAVWDGVFTFGEAVLFLAGLIIYILYSLNSGSAKKKSSSEKNGTTEFQVKPIIILLISGIFIYIGAKYTIESIIVISEMLNIGTEIIAVSAVAVGTSLPELAVTVSAVKQKNTELVIGNVLGSNIFNSFAVMGIPALITDLSIPENLKILGVPALIAASVLFLVATVDRQVSKWEGWVFILMYVFFLGKMFGII